MDKKVEIAKMIDHTLLRPEATEGDIEGLCNEAKEFGFYSVCIHPYFVKKVNEILSKTGIKISTVIGFPLGMTLPEVKTFEAVKAVSSGAEELDIVLNIGECKTGNWAFIKSEITDLVRATPDAVHKVIIEACYLTDDEKSMVSGVVMDAGAEFIKTSTGFAPGGAVISDIGIIKSATEGKIGIKAAGGIRTLRDVRRFIEAGASRIGTSSGVNIMNELQHLEKT
jgi:deoxyribose-phosphate aldolase